MTAYENYIIITENEYLSRRALIQLLGDNNLLYEHLLEHEYIKVNAANEVALNYVGVIAHGTAVVCAIPKYYNRQVVPSEQLISDFAKILKVLKRISKSYQIPDGKNLSASELGIFNELILADNLLRDYLEYGLYRKNIDVLLINGDGETNWNATVNQLNPIFSSKRPIYYDVYNSSAITEEYNVVTVLHKFFIRKYLKKFGKILDYNFTFTDDCVNEIFELGSVEYLRSAVRKELYSVYSDREILLLKRLLSVLNEEEFEESSAFSLFGTGYFHTVWEKVCAEVFQNRLEEYSHLIAKPLWNDTNGLNVTKKTLKPDIICTLGGEESKFFVLDAKYYDLAYQLKNGELSVDENPGIEDVSKQFLYEMAFRDVDYAQKYNCFLFPKLGADFYAVVGFVSFELFGDAKIYNVLISPKLLFNKYLNGEKIGEATLNEMALTFDGL